MNSVASFFGYISFVSGVLISIFFATSGFEWDRTFPFIPIPVYIIPSACFVFSTIAFGGINIFRKRVQ